MYTNVWSKYLPIIRIVLKKSLSSDQVLDLNIPDFERAGMTRKTGYKFLIKFKQGKVDNIIIAYPLASSLATVLLQDPVVKELFMQHEFHISMNPKFQLSMKHIPAVASETEEAVSEEKSK